MDFVELPEGASTVGCKLIYKTKQDSFGNIEQHKTRRFVQGFTQREGYDYWFQIRIHLG